MILLHNHSARFHARPRCSVTNCRELRSPNKDGLSTKAETDQRTLNDRFRAFRGPLADDHTVASTTSALGSGRIGNPAALSIAASKPSDLKPLRRRIDPPVCRRCFSSIYEMHDP
jgi:hypothetical protein